MRYKAAGIFRQTDHQGAHRKAQLHRQGTARNNGHIGRLDTAVGQVDAGRCLGSTRNPKQDDIGIFQIAGHLAVVMAKGEIHRIHALEIFSVQGVLQPWLAADFDSETGGQAVDETAACWLG